MQPPLDRQVTNQSRRATYWADTSSNSADRRCCCCECVRIVSLTGSAPISCNRLCLTKHTSTSVTSYAAEMVYESGFYDVFIPNRGSDGGTEDLSQTWLCLSCLCGWTELLQGVITSGWGAAGCWWANFNSPQNGKNLKWPKMKVCYTALLWSCDRDTAWRREVIATTNSQSSQPCEWWMLIWKDYFWKPPAESGFEKMILFFLLKLTCGSKRGGKEILVHKNKCPQRKPRLAFHQMKQSQLFYCGSNTPHSQSPTRV